MKRVTRAVREVGRDLRRSRSRKRAANRSSEEAEIEEVFDNIINNLNESVVESTFRSDSEEKSSKDWTFSAKDLPELPRDWKVKLREKVLRNMEASLLDVHIRCEVSAGGLDFCHSDNSPMGDEKKPSAAAVKNPDGRAFALGFTLGSFVGRTASEKWEIGSHDKNRLAMSSAKGHLGPNGYIVKNNKVGFFNSISIYWDEEPPILLAETDLLRGNFRKLSPDKLLTRIASAMDAMFCKQEPGKAVRQALSLAIPRYVSRLEISSMSNEEAHCKFASVFQVTWMRQSNMNLSATQSTRK